MSKQQRLERLLPGGKPRYIRIYDDGGYADRYTVVFTGRYSGRIGCDYIGMSGAPYWPQGICQHGWHQWPIDRPGYSHLGKPISFDDLPDDCKLVVLSDYCETWDLPVPAQAA